MKPLNLLMAVIGLSVNPVSSLCFMTGAKFEDRDLARSYVEKLCRDEFEGIYAPRAVKTKCIQLSPTQKIEFTVESNDYFGQNQLVDHWCTRPINRIIEACPRGSSADHGAFNFRVDPNNGKC